MQKWKWMKNDVAKLKKENINLTDEKNQFESRINERSLEAEKKKEQANDALNSQRESYTLEMQQLKSEKEAQADQISRLQKENRTILDNGKAKGDACQEELDLLKKQINEMKK